MNAGLVVEPRSLRLDASPSVALSLGKLTLRRPAPPSAAAATSGSTLIWKFRTTEPGVYAVRPAMGMFVSGQAGNDHEIVTVTRRAVSSGRRANIAGATPPRLKLSSVVLGPGCVRMPVGAATCASSAAEISVLWKTVADTPLLKASTVHQYVEIQLTTAASIARDRAMAAIHSAEPIDGQRNSSGRRQAASAPLADGTRALGSPACEPQSAGEWAAEMHQKAKSVPEYFLDPIMGRIFVDPVTTEVGNTYERASIERWLASGKRTDPLTNAVLEDTRLVPNNLLRSQIQAWRAAAPETQTLTQGKIQTQGETERSASPATCTSSNVNSSRGNNQQAAQRAADAAEHRASAGLTRQPQLQQEGARGQDASSANSSGGTVSPATAAGKGSKVDAARCRLVLGDASNANPAS